MSQSTGQSILKNFSHLFVLCKFLGIYPYNFQAFKQYYKLKKSVIGTVFVIVSMIVIIILYNLLLLSFSEEDNALKSSQSTLTFVIGIFLTYIGLVMMSTDQLSAIRNQERLSQLYDRMGLVDERLLQEGCLVDNTKLRKAISIMLVLVFLCEIAIMLSSYIILIDHTKWKSLLWIFSCFPTLYSSLDKIWFAVTLSALQQRFSAINKSLNDMVKEHELFKMYSLDFDLSGNKNDNITFLYVELCGAATDIFQYNKKQNRIMALEASLPVYNKLNDLAPKRHAGVKPIHEIQLNNGNKVEEKLNNYCQLHDELCEIGKILNELWSFPILVLMAYGFLIFTAQLYFLYCATQGQGIPSLFLSARNAFITSLFLIYTAGKCIYIIYLSWKTSLQAKCTGVYLHKCGISVDNNDIYEIINHLSLKLLNHSVDFSACGFFSLNMETLYGVSGGITSYLIILIQFNLAAQQAKETISSYMSNNSSDMDSNNYVNTTTMSLKDLISSTVY